ncbi:MAG TPA: glycosyltransferase, partial [Thermodesulfovibrio thiophilus]|nr:glycosyltransferase [Thermodesulfovibrio thiophilus]
MIFKSLLRKKKKIITTNISKDVSSGKYGCLDIVNEYGISGWFLNLDNPEDNEVIIKINGVEIGSIIPNFHRPDIYQLTGKNVKTGFSVSWDLLNLNENLIKEKSWNIELFNKEIPILGKKKISGIELEAIKNKIKHELFSPVTVDFNLADTKDLKMFIDRVEVKNNHINLIGRFYATELEYLNFKLKHNDATTTDFLTKYGIKREDVLTTLGEPEALYSGFISEVEVNDKGQYSIVLEVKYKNGKKDEYSLGTVIVRSRYKSNWTHGECKNLNIFYENLVNLTLQHKNNIEFLNLVMPETVDIIIPVFNGFHYLNPLFNSILKNTNEPYNLIIIDDASTDYRVVEYLNKLKETYPGKIILKRNKKNRGFTSSVNEGLRISNNNVVILNTDIEVPPGWLYRLMKPIFENPQISSTTPFTNAGTICSFPEFLKDNKLPANIFSEQIDEIFSGITLNDCLIELPTGIGFCMGLNKKALREVGIFDEKNFPVGYGEENDWCMRAKNRGFVNVIIPNLFVYHKHGGSFTNKQK